MYGLYALSSIPASFAFPGLTQLKLGYPSRAVALYGILLANLLTFSLTGWFYSEGGFKAFLISIAVWWLMVIMDGVYCAYQPKTIKPVKYVALAAVLIFACLLILIRFKSAILGIEIYRIPSPSMLPTLAVGSFVIVDTRVQAKEISNGDIIVFREPNNDIVYIKRVVGVPNQTLQMTGRCVTSRSKEVNYERCYSAYFQNTRPIKLTHDQFYLVGDNIRQSIDSRRFGPLDVARLEGRYTATVSPFF